MLSQEWLGRSVQSPCLRLEPLPLDAPITPNASKNLHGTIIVPNELERLLHLTCREPAYAAEFYRCVLASDVYALIPTEGHGIEEGKLRFVMWRGADGHDVIPYFASRAAVLSAVKPGWQPVKLMGRSFLLATLGATVVLNPNEAASCRLTPGEVTLLLDTGAVTQPRPEVLSEERVRAFLPVEGPPSATLQSLSVLLARHPAVQRAYMAYCFPPDQPDARSYLVLIRTDGHATEQLVRECAQLLEDVPPDRGMDMMTCVDDSHDLLQLLAGFGPPFYDRSWGARVMVPESTQPT